VRSQGGVKRLLRTRSLIVAGAVVAIGIAGLLWFQPQKLILDTRVSEAAPGESTSEDTSEVHGAGATKDTMSRSGAFRSIDHETSGTATLVAADDGRHYVRLEEFSTENGPDLFVYLSAAPATADGREYVEDFVDLGRLKGNLGNQNYLIPEGTDLERYDSVVVWCRRFTSAFGSAPLEGA
jgi:Electron transfer DM13